VGISTLVLRVSQPTERGVLVDSIDELDMYEAEKRLVLYNEYRDAIRVFVFYVETELRAYLCNKVDVDPVHAPGGTYLRVSGKRISYCKPWPGELVALSVPPSAPVTRL